MNNKKLSLIVLALGLSVAGTSVSQEDNNPPSTQRGMMMHGGMMHGGMMHGGMMHGGMMHGGMMHGGMMHGGMMHGGMMHGGMMHGGMMHCGMMHGGMFDSQLNLTDEQLQKIRSIMETAVSTMPQRQQQIMVNMPAHMAESQLLLNNSTFDEDKAREMISKHQALMVDNQIDMLKAQHQALQVLTEQQKAQYSALMAKHMAQMQQYLQGGQQ